MKPSLHVVEPPPAVTRFEAHRQAAAERAELELLSDNAKRARDASARAAQLFATASGSDPAHRATAIREATASLHAAFLLVTEGLGALGSLPL